MCTQLIIYCILILVFFILFEAIAITDYLERQKSGLYKSPGFVDHIRPFICAVFFPFVLLIVVMWVITESVLDRSEKK